MNTYAHVFLNGNINDRRPDNVVDVIVFEYTNHPAYKIHREIHNAPECYSCNSRIIKFGCQKCDNVSFVRIVPTDTTAHIQRNASINIPCLCGFLEQVVLDIVFRPTKIIDVDDDDITGSTIDDEISEMQGETWRDKYLSYHR